MTPLPLIDATSRPQTLHQLSMPLEDRREAARQDGELWGVVMLRATAPFHMVDAECVTMLLVYARSDDDLRQFAALAQEQHLSKKAELFQLIGSEEDVYAKAARMGLHASHNVAEVTVRMVDRLARAVDIASIGTETPGRTDEDAE